MVGRHVRIALAAGIAAGDEDVARAELARIDWVLRRVARRRFERALVDATLASGQLASNEADAIRHIQQVAALALAGAPAADPADHAAVTAGYAALPVPRRSRIPVATILSVALATAALTALVGYIATRPGPAARHYARPMPPSSPTAFRDGGVPLHDAGVEAALAGPLTDLLIAADDPDASDATRTRLLAGLRADPAFATRGAPLAQAWKDLLGNLEHWPERASGDQSHAAGDVFRGSARLLSDQLAAAGLGYVVDGDTFAGSSRAQAALSIYRVEEIVFVVAGGKPRRVVSLRRIDHLNLTRSELGLHSEELADPVLLLDQIDRHVATQVMPVLAAEAVFPLGDPSWSPTAPAKALAATAGVAVRRELHATLGTDTDAAVRIAALLHERADLVATWRDTLERHHRRMIDTNELFLPEGLLEQLDGLVPHYQRERVSAIEDELATLDAPRIASLCHALVAASVRRHEAEHGFDADRPEPLRYPAQLAEETGDEANADGQPRGLVIHARHELGAWLAQIANDPNTPQLVTWDLGGHAFSRYSWGSPESYAAIVVLDGLARQLGGGAHEPLIHGGEIDRDRLAAVAMRIAQANDADLRAAAAALWTELYGEPLTTIVDR